MPPGMMPRPPMGAPMSIRATPAEIRSVSATANAIVEQVAKAIIGKRKVLEDVLISILADGHTLAARKLQAARKLADAELPAEALTQASSAMTHMLRALAPDPDQIGDVPPSRLLYETLVPRGILTLEQAAMISRAEGLSRAYTDSTLPVPPNLLQIVMADAQRLLQHLSGCGE